MVTTVNADPRMSQLSNQAKAPPAPAPFVRPIAFYAPQSHPVREHSDQSGNGDSDWVTVAAARPNFDGHYQPHIPRDLGFYDLRLPNAIEDQATLARSNSIFGFCFYFHWSPRRRDPGSPISLFHESKIDLNFCFCWTNEQWTQPRASGNNEALWANDHDLESDNQFIEDVIPYLRDDRYIRFDGCPLLLVHQTNLLKNSQATFAHWRRRVREAGLPGIFIACVAFCGVQSPTDWGADALVEFPPHQYRSQSSYDRPLITNQDFQGSIFDYRMVIAQSIDRRHDDFLLFHGAMPSWDNTAGSQNASDIFLHSSPDLFEFWLRHQVIKTIEDHRNKENFLFINAWNDWTHGCHLEPCLRLQHANLAAVRRAIRPDRYLAPRPQHDSMIGALAAIDSYTIDDARYFSQLELSYESALSDIMRLKQRLEELRDVYNVWSPEARSVDNIPLPEAFARALRSRPLVYKTARIGYRLARATGWSGHGKR